MEIGGIWHSDIYLFVHFRGKELILQKTFYQSEDLPIEIKTWCLCFLPLSQSSQVVL